MIKANHYIAMEADKNNEQSMIFGAFYFENLITKLDALNVGSCWVTITNASEESKKRALGENSNVDFLLAMGYAPNDDDFDLYIKDYKGIENLIDAGIVMYYYTELANYNSIDANWVVKDNLSDKDNYKYIASVNF